jgi:hypothetical protein
MLMNQRGSVQTQNQYSGIGQQNLGTYQGGGASSVNPLQGIPTSGVSDDVIKFILKLKSNNIQNLKNALRKLGERTFGNKEQLLIRLANKLATPEGKHIVRTTFKPDIY